MILKKFEKYSVLGHVYLQPQTSKVFLCHVFSTLLRYQKMVTTPYKLADRVHLTTWQGVLVRCLAFRRCSVFFLIVPGIRPVFQTNHFVLLVGISKNVFLSCWNFLPIPMKFSETSQPWYGTRDTMLSSIAILEEAKDQLTSPKSGPKKKCSPSFQINPIGFMGRMYILPTFTKRINQM